MPEAVDTQSGDVRAHTVMRQLGGMILVRRGLVTTAAGRLLLVAFAVTALIGCADEESDDPAAVSQSAADPVDPWWLKSAPGPQDRTLDLLVHEQDCASGQSAKGLIASDVQYEKDAVIVRVNVRARTEDRSCPGNPDTPYEIALREPLGDREVLDGNRTPPGPARTERPVP